jgi:enoyl-CoA hydratase
MAFEAITIEIRESAGLITLDRPEKLNALSNTLANELDSAVTGFEQDDEVKAIIITGVGEKAFSAGGDIHEMSGLSEAELKERSVRRVAQFWHWATCKKPTIAAINGLAYGGGALLSSVFDMRIGCERSSFRFLGATYGRVNSTWTLPLIVGLSVAKELLFTARVVDAEDAFRIGLLNKLVPAAELMKASLDMVKLIAGNDARVVPGIKDILNRSVGMGFSEMYENEMHTVAASLKAPHPSESFAGFLKRTGKH